MRNKALLAIEQYDMLPGGSTVVVGFSGGADSMALLHFLKIIEQEKGITVTAAHVNHGLRGEEADADEAFARSWCERNGVPISILHADVKKEAQASGKGLEECGREIRYLFFQSLALEHGSKIATAHTLSDQCETLLLNLTRGAGLTGLCGIPPVRGNIIRPLLTVTRQETEAYCRENGLSYVTDSTNLEDVYTRNRLRHQVLPVLKECNPSFEQSVLRLTQALSQDERYLAEKAKEALSVSKRPCGYDAVSLAALPEPLLARAVMLAARERGTRLEANHVETVLGMLRGGSGAVMAPGGLILRVKDGLLTLKDEKDSELEPWCAKLQIPRTVLGDGRICKVEVITHQEYLERKKINKNLFNISVSYDTISDNAVLRSRLPGDSFSPYGRKLTKSLKKLYNEAAVPCEKRNRLCILESGGSIRWIEGFGPSEEACVKDTTKSVALIIPEEC